MRASATLFRHAAAFFFAIFFASAAMLLIAGAYATYIRCLRWMVGCLQKELRRLPSLLMPPVMPLPLMSLRCLLMLSMPLSLLLTLDVITRLMPCHVMLIADHICHCCLFHHHVINGYHDTGVGGLMPPPSCISFFMPPILLIVLLALAGFSTLYAIKMNMADGVDNAD